jgi:hypothetical protein
MSFNVETYFTDQAKGIEVLYYRGNIDPEVINHVLDSAEDKLSAAKEQSRLRKRVYNVLVESSRIFIIMLIRFLWALKISRQKNSP